VNLDNIKECALALDQLPSKPKVQKKAGRPMGKTINIEVGEGSDRSRVQKRSGDRFQRTQKVALYAVMRSAFAVFYVKQVDVCRKSHDLKTSEGLVAITSGQLSRFLAGESEINVQSLESLEISLYLVNPNAYHYYKTMLEQNHKAIADLHILKHKLNSQSNPAPMAV
jgi:hypothetical protein